MERGRLRRGARGPLAADSLALSHLGLPGQWQPNREGRPCRRAALDVDPAVVPFDDFLADRQAQTGARLAGFEPCTSTVEALEEMRQVLLRDGRLRVVDPNGGAAAAAGLVRPGGERPRSPPPPLTK